MPSNSICGESSQVLYKLLGSSKTGAVFMSENEPGLFKKWFWNTYDYLGTLIIINILCVLLLLPLVTIPFAFAGLFRVTGRIAAYEKAGIRDFFSYNRTDLGRYYCLCLLYLGALLALFINIFFYVNAMPEWPWVGAILSGVMIWLVAFVCMTAVYTFPLAQSKQFSVRQIIQLGIFLVIDNMKRSIILLIGGGLVIIFSLVSGVGLVFIGLGATAVLFSTGVREIRKRYDFSEEHIFEEVRGWRDLFRPWGYS